MAKRAAKAPPKRPPPHVLPCGERCTRCKVRGRVIKSIKKIGRGRAYRLRRYQCPKCHDRWNAYLSRINPARVQFKTGLE